MSNAHRAREPVENSFCEIEPSQATRGICLLLRIKNDIVCDDDDKCVIAPVVKLQTTTRSAHHKRLITNKMTPSVAEAF